MLFTGLSEHSQDQDYPKATNSYVIGLCTGALAAAAVCSSTTFSNLLPAAVHSVIVAFRTGTRAVEVARTILSPSRGLMGDWSILCPGLILKEDHEAIKAFIKVTVRLLNHSSYCSQLTMSSIFRLPPSHLSAPLPTTQ